MRNQLRHISEHAYLTLVGFFLMWNVFYMTEAAWTFALAPLFPALSVVLMVWAICLGRGRIGMAYIPLILLGWMTLASAEQGSAVLRAQIPEISNGLIAFGAVLPAAMVTRKRRFMAYFRGMLGLWTACFTLQSLIGLWCALTGHAVFSLRGTWYIGLNLGDGRLYLNAYVTTAATKLGLSVLLALLGGAMCHRMRFRAVYALCAAIQLICLSLTDCRTAFIALGVMAGIALALLTRRRVKHRGLRVLLSGISALAATVTVYLALVGLLTFLAPHVPTELDSLTLNELPGHLIPSAAAEESGLTHREISADNLFNSRQDIWSAAIRLLCAEPRYLLTGTTSSQARFLTNLYAEGASMRFDHVHSIYLQTLVNWGVPGFGLLAALLIMFGKSAVKTLKAPRPETLLPVLIVCYVLLCDAADCFTRLNALSPQLLWACLCGGLILSPSKEENA